MLLTGAAVLEQTDHFPQHSELHEFGFPCEPKSTCDQESHKDVSPNKVVEGLQHGMVVF